MTDPVPSADVVVLSVCTTCRTQDDASEARPGAQLLAALRDEARADPVPGLKIEGVECLSVCKRPCTIAVSSQGRWSYLYGDLDPAISPGVILEGIRLYAATPDGIVPWRSRPIEFRKGVVARIPPLTGKSDP